MQWVQFPKFCYIFQICCPLCGPSVEMAPSVRAQPVSIVQQGFYNGCMAYYFLSLHKKGSSGIKQLKRCHKSEGNLRVGTIVKGEIHPIFAGRQLPDQVSCRDSLEPGWRFLMWKQGCKRFVLSKLATKGQNPPFPFGK